MASNLFSKSLKRSALTVALGLCFAGGVSAQSSVGSIFGDAAANTAVTMENLDTGTSREITSDASGKFTFSQLSPGRYRVTSGGVSREVQVKVGTGTPVSLAAADANTLATVTVVGSGSINPIDVSSVESTTVFTAEQIASLPVGRDVTNVALLAPGTVRGDTGFGNLASFGGSSVAENGYYINGFDVTNIRNFVSYATLPFDAIGEQQVKTGGYGAEYGRSLGGVINILTKRGTNEWKGGVSAYWNPDSLREPGKDVLSRDPADAATNDQFFVYRSDNNSDSWSVNLWGGGPLIRDRLFIFGLIETGKSEGNVFAKETSYEYSSGKPNGMLKLDWNITDNHLLEFTGISNRDTTDYVNYHNAAGQYYTGEHGPDVTSEYGIKTGGEVYIAKYTGYLTDNFTISAQAGYLESIDNYRTPEALPGADCPRVWDSRGANPGALVYRGCWNQAQATIRDPNFGPDTDTRKAYRIDAEWRLGAHDLRFGFDHETFTSGHAGSIYTGQGVYYRYFSNDALGWFDLPPGTDFVRTWESQTESGEYEVINTAAYLEDSWQVTDTLMLYGGVRMETFENLNAAGTTFVKSDELFAPRLGFSWDVNGDSTFKVFGNAGRYYIPVAANTNIRASSAEYFAETYYLFTGIDPTTYAPILGELLDGPYVNGSLTPPDPRTVAATNLEPMYQDEFILGMQLQLSENWSMGVRGISREVKSGMDDYCTHAAFNEWAADNGFDSNFALDGDGIDMASCFMVNPGKDVSLAMDPDNDGDLEVYNVAASYLGLPEYSRQYHALEIFWEKGFKDNWFFQGSYTFAKSKGNVEGYVNSTLEQDDAGLTQDFDHEVFERGAYGYLPNDRRHTLKMFGMYEFANDWRISGNFLLQSGRPVNCNGYAPIADLGIPQPDAGSLGAYGPSTFYCRNEAGQLVLGNRGDRGRTPWTRSVDLGLAYTPSWLNDKLTVKVDVFNVLNADTVTEYNETSATLRTQTFLDPNFLNDVNYQTPRSVRFSVRYQF